jgi:hypothetical protein
VRGTAEPGRTRLAIIRLGEEAAARLAALPDTPELRALDRKCPALTPPGGRLASGRIAQQMRRLVERYRDEAGIDRLALEAALFAAYAGAVAAAARRPDISQQEQAAAAL